MLEFEISQTALHLKHLVEKDSKSVGSISINGDVLTITDTDYNSIGMCLKERETSVIENLLREVGVNPDMCLDCMTDDNMKNSEFFVHLMRAYVHFLMLKYGPSVPVSRDMAKYFLKHDLLADYVIYNVTHSRIVNKGELYPGCFYDLDAFVLSESHEH